MRWKSGRRSENIEDRRRSGPGRSGGRGGGRRLPVGKRTAGGGLGLLVVVVLGLIFGVDPSTLLNFGGQMQTAPSSGVPGGMGMPNADSGGGRLSGSMPEGFGADLSQGRRDELADFVSVVLADTEDTWNAIFRAGNARYREPKLVLFTHAVQSACGLSKSAMGPFYCPADEKVYIDLAFYDELKTKYRAPGDFAQAYVIAHEVGHHVQNLLGISDQVTRAERSGSKSEANRLSVMLELQADCFAGVWANHAQAARHILEQGDLEEGLNAAAQIGDDRMQKRSMGYAVPDSFTHGSSEQRVRWFRTGLTEGTLEACNTFEAKRL